MLNEIKEIIHYSPLTAQIVIENGPVACAARPGHFVIVRFDSEGMRIPFTIVKTSADDGTISIIIHRAAGLGNLLSTLEPGMVIPDLLGPLGQAMEIDENATVVCIGDGAGFVPLLPVIRSCRERNTSVISVFSEQSAQAACLLPLVEKYSEIVDASASGVETALNELLARVKPDHIIMSGPTTLLKSIADITRHKSVRATAILNMMMIDGVGLCGICRVMVGGKRLLTCIEGPAFDAHAIDFDQLLNRQRHFV
ncbi:MAG: hypothetical protein K2K47_04750 [Duncaniella sp.]|nr:hypothetical protein [Duncaniella sp.]